jgi:type II secretory pathway pseudopilin PulG
MAVAASGLTMRNSERQRGYTLVDLLAVVGIISVASVIAVPMTDRALAGQRFKSDAQALNNLVGLAKMRASGGFTRARVRANLDNNSFLLERWDRTADAWVVEGGTERVFRGVQFGSGGVTDPPPNTQVALAQSPACRVGVTPGSATIGNTACIVFNSRGLPVDGDGTLFGGHALYLTDGNAVYATTITATPRIRLWWRPAAQSAWSEQQ